MKFDFTTNNIPKKYSKTIAVSATLVVALLFMFPNPLGQQSFPSIIRNLHLSYYYYCGDHRGRSIPF